MNDILGNLTSGFKSSELYVTVGAAVGGVLAKMGVLCSAASTTCSPGAFSDQDFAVLMGGVAFYVVSRFALKNKNLTLRAALSSALTPPAAAPVVGVVEPTPPVNTTTGL